MHDHHLRPRSRRRRLRGIVRPHTGQARLRSLSRRGFLAGASAWVGGVFVSRELLGSVPIRTPRRALRRPHEVIRLRCLYNGYMLTVDPAKALSPASAADRYRLWVLHALLVDPATGKVAAIFPPLGTPDFAGGPVAQPASSYTSLRNDEEPRSPGLTAAQVLAYWHRTGVDTALLDDAEWLDLQGAVVTPGLTDTHFHVTSWSKKLPAPGQRFGYWADLSDPAY